MRFIIVLFFITFFLHSCERSKDVYDTPTFSTDGTLNAVIEIPAGTNTKIEYNLDSKKFAPDQRDGRDRVIAFLPYPANYGFIPSTLSDPAKGGDGDALDILVICPALETGRVIKVIPIAMLNVIDAGEIDSKIIAIPADPKLQTVVATSLDELREKYPKAEELIITWFLNYDPGDGAEIKGVSNEHIALEEIKRNLKN